MGLIWVKNGMARQMEPSEEQLEEQRVKWLKAVAEFLFELEKLKFDKCGMLNFKDNGDELALPVSLTWKWKRSYKNVRLT